MLIELCQENSQPASNSVFSSPVGESISIPLSVVGLSVTELVTVLQAHSSTDRAVVEVALGISAARLRRVQSEGT